jgi:hypothetical protein
MIRSLYNNKINGTLPEWPLANMLESVYVLGVIGVI